MIELTKPDLTKRIAAATEKIVGEPGTFFATSVPAPGDFRARFGLVLQQTRRRDEEKRRLAVQRDLDLVPELVRMIQREILDLVRERADVSSLCFEFPHGFSAEARDALAKVFIDEGISTLTSSSDGMRLSWRNWLAQEQGEQS